MVRKRWRGVAPYFYTVWPLLCIIPHLARSRPEMPARAMQISPPLKTRTYQAFRRMMDDAGRPTEGFTLVALFLARRTRFRNSPDESREYLFYERYQYLYYFNFFFIFQKLHPFTIIKYTTHLYRVLEIKMYVYKLFLNNTINNRSPFAN